MLKNVLKQSEFLNILRIQLSRTAFPTVWGVKNLVIDSTVGEFCKGISIEWYLAKYGKSRMELSKVSWQPANGYEFNLLSPLRTAPFDAGPGASSSPYLGWLHLMLSKMFCCLFALVVFPLTCT